MKEELLQIQAQIREAWERLWLPSNQIEKLISMDHKLSKTISLSNWKTFEAFRMQHNNNMWPYKWGIRFAPDVWEDEVMSLATIMTIKNAATNIPFGWAKWWILVEPWKLSPDEIKELSEKYVEAFVDHLWPDTDVPAPDMNTNWDIMWYMVDEYERLTWDKTHASFTGKNLDKYWSAGRLGATGNGRVLVLANALASLWLFKDGFTYALQWYGKVGSFFAKYAHDRHPNWKLVEARDYKHTIRNLDWLEASELIEVAKGGKTLDQTTQDVEILNRDIVLEADVDVLVLRALGGVITMDNVDKIKAKVVLEIANDPISKEAEEYLDKKWIIVIPDIIANAWWVVTSYLEWIQNKNKESWPLDRVLENMYQYLEKSIEETFKTSMEFDISLKKARIINALRRLI